MNAIAQAFLDQFDQSFFPQELLTLYEPTGCLAKKPNCETYLLKHRETGLAYVAKVYTHEARQLNEGAILRGLDFPGIPRVLGEYANDDALFVVREYIEGKPLSDLIADRTMGLLAALELMLRLADIVAFLQRQRPQIVHRDIKPSNLIVDGEGRLWLIDFEIARRVDPESSSSDTVLMLTENYAAPEQFGYQQTDGRTDIYAMGVVFLFLLTGGIDLKRIDERVASAGARAVIRKCTSFAPGDRYPSAEALKKALLRLDAIATRRARIHHPIALTAAIAFVCGMACMLGLARLGGLSLFERPPAEASLPSAAPTETLLPSAAPTETLLPSTAPTEAPLPSAAPTETPLASAALTDAPAVKEVIFASPVIERAVLLMLGRIEGEPVYEDELTQITQLFIFYGTPVAHDQDYNDLLSGDATANPRPELVELDTLSDLKMLPELTRLLIAGAIVPDLEPLSSLPKLSQLVFNNCEHMDLSSLSGCTSVEWMGLSGTRVVSYKPLSAMNRLKGVALCGSDDDDYSFLEGKQNLESFALIHGNADHLMPYLAGRRLNYLNLYSVDNLTMDMLAQVDATDFLALGNCVLPGLSGIERMTNLQRLDMSGIRISDYSPLLALPNLKSLTIDQIQRPALLQLPQPLPFEVSYR